MELSSLLIKMKAKYIFRLDDASPFSNLKKWQAIEDIFQKYEIKPIVAVIPDNKDSSLIYQELNPNFWKMVQDWDAKGWSIAMHGYQHLFHSISRYKSIIPYYKRSEFSGLTLESQKLKIKRSLKIFRQNNLEPKVWVAPAHSFDYLTLKAISQETNIEIISDGISRSQYFDSGFHFIPQQLWSIKKKNFGLWTVCLHPDTMSDEEINDFDKRLLSSRIFKSTISLRDVELTSNHKTLLDYCFSALFFCRFFVSRIYRNWSK